MSDFKVPKVWFDGSLEWAELAYTMANDCGDYELAIKIAEQIREYHNRLWNLKIEGLKTKILESKTDTKE